MPAQERDWSESLGEIEKLLNPLELSHLLGTKNYPTVLDRLLKANQAIMTMYVEVAKAEGKHYESFRTS